MTHVEDLLREAMHAQTPHLTLSPDAASRALGARGRRRRRIGAAALSLAVVAGAAVGLAVATRPTGSDRVTNGPAIVTSGSAHDQTVAETKRLIALVPVPASATPLAHAPAPLSGPAMGIPNTTALVISTRIVRVPLSVSAAEAYLATHKPAGLADGGHSGGAGPDGGYVGVAYRDRDSPAWTNAQLEIGVTALGTNASAWRIDGLAIELDRKPLPDTAAGTRVHVTVAQGCPASDRGVVGVRNEAQGYGLDSTLLPSLPLVSALACRYDGLNGARFALIAQESVGPVVGRRLAAEVQASTLSHPAGTTVVNCPMDDLSAATLAFHYSGGPDFDVFVRTNGCTTIANGSILGQPSSSLMEDLASMTTNP